MHISVIREARNSEQSTLEKCLKTLNLKIDKFGKRSLSSSQKKQLDERFNAITQRIECFSPVKKVFCGKHIRLCHQAPKMKIVILLHLNKVTTLWVTSQTHHHNSLEVQNE